MSAHQSESSIGVVKGRVEPSNGVVTLRAKRSRETGSDVIGDGAACSLGACPSSLVATVAIGVGRSESVVSADVTLGTSGDFACGGHLVRIGEWKSSGAVVEHAVGPDGDGMARRAGRGSSGKRRGDVVGNIAAKGLRAEPGRLMAAHAVGGAQGVVVIDVAGDAGSRRRRHMRASEGEAGSAVIECGRIPSDGVVASGAVCRGERRAGCRVRGIVSLLPSREVATRVAAIRVCGSERVIAADVALGAGGDFACGGHLVRIGEREAGAAVIKNAIGPGGDGMARGAGRGSSGKRRGDVVGNIAAKGLRAEPGRLMTAHAVSGAQGVVVIDVAGDAGSGRWRHMRADKSETCGSVIERRDVGPGDGVVASGAIRGGKLRSGGRVRGIVGLLPCREVTTRIGAIRVCGSQGVIAADVALGAGGDFACGGHLMRIGKREAGAAVIKNAIGPGGDGMAGGAGGGASGEIGSDVIRHIAAKRLRVVPVGLMTTEAVGGIQGVIIIDMAGSARSWGWRHVRAGSKRSR